MRLTLPDQSRLVAAFWQDAPSLCPSHEVPMRTFFVDRVYKPQVVMVCPKGEMFRFAQKPKQIEFSRPHLKTMVRDAQERESPACPQDFEPLFVYRTPAVFIPQGWDYGFVCPNCLSYGEWVETGREEEDVVAARQAEEGGACVPRRDDPPSQAHGDGKGRRPRPSSSMPRWRRRTARPAATTARVTRRRSPRGKEKDPNLCVPGKEETAKVVHDLLKGTGLPAAASP